MENWKNSGFPFPKTKMEMENSIYMYFLSSISGKVCSYAKRKGLKQAAFSSGWNKEPRRFFVFFYNFRKAHK